MGVLGVVGWVYVCSTGKAVVAAAVEGSGEVVLCYWCLHLSWRSFAGVDRLLWLWRRIMAGGQPEWQSSAEADCSL